MNKIISKIKLSENVLKMCIDAPLIAKRMQSRTVHNLIS